MIFDHRTYTCRPGTIKTQLKMYEDHGLVPQCRHLGQPVLYGAVETGNINSFIHVWAYENAADREARRASMWQDADWLAYVKMTAEAGNIAHQETTILNATSFFKLPG